MTTAATAAANVRRAVGDVFAGRALLAFYVAVLAVALVGSTQGVKNWIGWPLLGAFGAVFLAELGGVALSKFADGRRRKGERALLARVLSAAFAAGAIAVQLRGHAGEDGTVTSIGLFFAWFSAAGYVVYLLDSAAQRRDALRDKGKLADTPPAYGAYQWTRHPFLTARARRLAVANAETRLIEQISNREAGHGGRGATTPVLGRAASLAQAAAEVTREHRVGAIRKEVRKLVAEGVNPTMAKIAINTFDLDKVATGLAEGANYPALTELLGAELTPQRIAAGIAARRQRRWFGRSKPAVQTSEIVAALTPALAPQTAQTAPQTAPQTAQTAPQTGPARPLPVVPHGARLLTVRVATALPPGPASIPVTPAQRTPETAQTEPETEAQTEAQTAQTEAAPDTAEPETEAAPDTTEQLPPVPHVNPALLPHLLKVMRARPDWNVVINIEAPRHPEALTLAKIKSAAGITGQQTATEIRAALKLLSEHPGAQEYVEKHTPDWAMT